ncbi:MAG: hypothetical protein QXW21_02545 [Candidatus Methanomethylicaceae archaeon]
MLLGIILPEALTNVINKTKFENRGIKCAIIFITMYSLTFFLYQFSRSLYDVIFMLITLKFFSLIFGLKTHKPLVFEDYIKSKLSTKFSFLLLWFVFMFIDHFSSKIFSKFFPIEFLIRLQTLILLIGLVFTMVGGFLIDRFGRKSSLLLSYVYLGIVYAIVTIIGRIEFIILEGLVWGILTLLFTMVIWGDLCNPRERIFYIALSIIIILINRIIIILIPPIIEIQQLFSFISLFLFISAFIILLIPETLPENVRRKRELSSYIKKVKKIKEKYG